MRRIIESAAKIVVSGALLYFALRKVDLHGLFARINSTSLAWIGIAVVIALLQLFLATVRWCYISDRCAAPLSVVEGMRLNLIGAFFNQTLPSSIGGDAVKLWLVARAGSGWRAAAYSIFVDRAVGLIAVAVLIGLTLPWSVQLLADPQGRFALLTVEILALSGGIGFLLFGALRWSWLRNWWGTRHLHHCAMIADEVLLSRRLGPAIALLSISVHVLTVVIAWCIVRSIAAPVSFAQLFQLVPPVTLITMIPISVAGWGVREATMGLAFGYAGLLTAEGVNVSLLFGAVYFALGALGGLAWILRPREARGKLAINLPGHI